ncbi:MAG: AMP-binding enzyme, partial [Cyclobacteriaceae bacterium]
LRALMNLWAHAKFCNVYGPAEVNQCTYYHLPGPPNDDNSVPLGMVWDNTEMLILDESDQPVPPGISGELLIRSSTMMKGYWQQPELTQESLYFRMTAPGNEDVFYRTGDLVSLDVDGNLQFLGRKDRQIKTRGYRVELDEVENLLLRIEAVEEAAVFPISHERDGLLVEAAVILKAETSATEEDLRKWLAEQLAMYAVPRAIHVLQSLPRTSNGKINRLQLQQRFSKIADA